MGAPSLWPASAAGSALAAGCAEVRWGGGVGGTRGEVTVAASSLRPAPAAGSALAARSALAAYGDEYSKQKLRQNPWHPSPPGLTRKMTPFLNILLVSSFLDVLSIQTGHGNITCFDGQASIAAPAWTGLVYPLLPPPGLGIALAVHFHNSVLELGQSRHLRQVRAGTGTRALLQLSIYCMGE